MRINTNINSMNAYESTVQTNLSISSSLEKLSSGLRINKASDDASGLAIADKLRTQANGLNQAVSNGNSGITLTQIADKAMGEQSNIIDIVKQKLIQASTATTSLDGTKAIAKDIKKLLDQIDNIAVQTEYNGMSLLQRSAGTTSAATAYTFQMGVNAANTIVLNSSESIRSNVSGLGLQATFSAVQNTTQGFLNAGTAVSAQGIARGLLAGVDTALSQLNTWRADIGSTQNQLESSVRNMMTQVTNVKAAESVIRDVDYAQESAHFNKMNIISQAGTYAMSQANSAQQNVMKLLQ